MNVHLIRTKFFLPNDTELYCDSNELSELDLTNNTKMENFSCDESVTVIGYQK